MVLREIDVDASGRCVLLVRPGALIEVLLRVRVRQVGDRARRSRGSSNTGEETAGDRVERRELIVLLREGQQIDLAHLLDAADSHVVAEPSLLSTGVQDRPRPRRLGRLIELLHIEEEECLVAAVEETGDDDRSAQPPAVLMDDDVVALEPADLVEVVVRVQLGVTEVVIDAAVEVVGAGPRDKRDLHGAERGLIRRRRGSGDGHFLDRVEPRRDHREEAVGRLEVVVHVDAVVGHADRVLGQAADGRSPGSG